MKQENCCTPIGEIKRYVDCIGCDRKPDSKTLEEAAEKYPYGGREGSQRKAFIEGAKWMQQRSYSEEEVEILLENYHKKAFSYTKASSDSPKEWFEQFKKK